MELIIYNLLFLLFFVIVGYAAYYCFRRGFGWQLFRGCWMKPDDVERRKKEISENFR